MRKVWLEKNTYRDSVSLMHLASQIEKMDGVLEAAILMGTPSNLARLKSAGYQDASLAAAGINDLCIGINASDGSSLDAAEKEIQDFLTGKLSSRSAGKSKFGVVPKTITSAVRHFPSANLAAISAPGEYAGREARSALEHNLHVFLFSDNVSIEEEVKLKALAGEKGLLFMGPDCGTAYIHGTPLGFCNNLDRGPVGLVAASGTGAQEISCLLTARGVGVSHILGTGGRDLSKPVGGVASITALKVLASDAETEVIVVVSKPPDPDVEKLLRQVALDLDKPVVLCFIGKQTNQLTQQDRVFDAQNLAHAADIAAALVQKVKPAPALNLESFISEYGADLQKARTNFSAGQKYIRGLYSGGSLADEAAIILASLFEGVHAGAGFGEVLPIDDWDESLEHMIIDLGDDRFTKGRPHPMIDPGIRIQRMQEESLDSAVAVVLMDVVLGSNADPDPSQNLVPAVRQVQETARKAGRTLPVVIHICGVEKDQQNLEKQAQAFHDAGCLIFPSNAEAAFAAAYLAGAEI